MKKERATKSEVLTATLILLMLIGHGMPKVQAAGREKSLVKTVSLDSEAVTQIPRYITEGGAVYRLDESSVVVEETGRSHSEGARVAVRSKKVENLPDNDLERIEKTVTLDGSLRELLSVDYEVTERDEDGIPVEYSALCEYGGLEKYRESYPSQWQAVCRYEICSAGELPETAAARKEYGYLSFPPKTEETKRSQEKKSAGEKAESEVPSPEPEVKRYILRKITPGAEGKEEKLPGLPAGLAAAALAGGLTVPFILWIFLLTAPIYAMREDEKYCRIGRIRLKREEEAHTAYLTERLAAKAQLPVFRIKLNRGIRKRIKTGMLQVRCPDGKKILLTVGREVRFTWEKE